MICVCASTFPLHASSEQGAQLWRSGRLERCAAAGTQTHRGDANGSGQRSAWGSAGHARRQTHQPTSPAKPRRRCAEKLRTNRKLRWTAPCARGTSVCIVLAASPASRTADAHPATMYIVTAVQHSTVSPHRSAHAHANARTRVIGRVRWASRVASGRKFKRIGSCSATGRPPPRPPTVCARAAPSGARAEDNVVPRQHAP